MAISTCNALHFSKFKAVHAITKLLNLIEPSFLKRHRRKANIVYSLCMEDIDTVAFETLSRPLTREETQLIIDELPKHVKWFDAIESAIYESRLAR